MRFGAFIITYNRPDILRQTLTTVLSQTRPPQHVLVVDNGDGDATQTALAAFSSKTVVYHSMGGNVGPAGATAYALSRLADEEYDWI